jgi:pimeloyl-ACP methyl ester carboxylesterase
MKSHYFLLTLLASFAFGMPEAQATLKKTCFTIKILRHPIKICLPIPEPPRCDKEPTGVKEEDYWLDVVTENMPDPNLDGQLVQMHVHRVKPVYANGKCPNVHNHAAVLVHGRSAPGTPSFDLRLAPTEEDPTGGRRSAQEALAWAGIDSFVPDLLGYGESWRGPLDDPCNASLPACVVANADGSCPANAPNPIEGTNDCSPVTVGCDRTRAAPVFPVNQQANRPVGLGVNPGLPLCAHSSPYHFANPDVFASNILDVIDFAIDEARPKSGKVVLLGYSFGGPSTARTLYLLGDRAERKVKRAVFMNSLFNVFPGAPGTPPLVTNLPTEEEDLSELERSTSFPLALGGIGSWTGVGTPARDAQCTGRITPDVITAFWDQIMALDPLGDTWGGTVPNVYDENGEVLVNNATGLLRSPTFTRNGWNPEVAATFTLPTLIMHAADDTVALPANSNNMFEALTSVTDKVLVQVECSSHQFIGEGCDLGRCDDQDPNTTPYGQDPDDPIWRGPSRTIAAALVEWIKDGSFNESKCGHFIVNPSGIANEVATPNCPVEP